jgi:ribosomal protein S18 acetylase RimI-like enzyme
VAVKLRRPTEHDRRALAEMAAALQCRPGHHIAYLGDDPDTIAAEMIEDVDDWTEAAAVAEHDGRVIGWLMGSIDHEMGRVWWFGPFVDADDAGTWTTLADRLDATARVGLPDAVDEEEYAFDARHSTGPAWAAGRGFHADPGSAVLALDHPIAPSELPVRPVTADDASTVGRLHDALFPNTHTTGAALVATADPAKCRLVAERDGHVLGYVAVERQADGGGYIDFLGVDPAHRRQGIGAQLVRAGVASLAELGCERFDLTVRVANTGARALYASLGFVEERVILPFRRGFTLP